MDLIAVPGGFPGAMENWGAITYDESTVLFDPKTDSQRRKEEVFHIIAHETAHQWFGDLVTMAWWNDIWLNEGFASWMDLKVTDQLNPDWQVWLRANNDKYGAMNADARATSHPIQQPLKNPTEISQAFDDITYIKGAAVIRMIETDFGEASFRDGIRHYMAAHKYSNTTTADLWNALSKSSGQPVARIAGTWTEQPGFPVVTAQTVCRGGAQTLMLSQQRFFTDLTPPGKSLWQIPIALSGARLSGKHPYLMTGASAKLSGVSACGAPVIVNAGNAGYYRVQYEGALWKAVERESASLPPADKLALLSDRWALVRADRVPSTDYLDLAQSLRGDTNLAVWDQISGTMGTIDVLEIDQPGRPAFHACVCRLLNPVLARIGAEPKPGEDETTKVLRQELTGALGGYDDPAIIAQARARFAAFVKDPSSLPPDARPAVMGIVGRYADQATYDQLHQLGRQTTDFAEKQMYYFSMTGALDPKLAQETLGISLTDELPNPYGSFLIQAVGGSEHPALAWDFYKRHQAQIDKMLSEQFDLEFAPGLTAEFTDPARADELIAFSKTHLPAGAKKHVAMAVTRIRSAARLKKRELARIDAWVKSQMAASSSQTQVGHS